MMFKLDASNPHKVNIVGLVSTVQASTGAPFPLRHPEFCVYIEASGGRGQGDWQVVIENAEEQEPIFEGNATGLALATTPWR
jgi:hypothetical protein